MFTTNLKKGDNIIVLSGKDKGKNGKVIQVDRKTGKVAVEGINVHTRFERKGKAKGGAGQKVSFPSLMNASKLMLVCPSCSKPTRIGHKFLDNGEKQRVCKNCEKAI